MASVLALTDVEALYLPGMAWLQFLYAHPRAMHAMLIMADEMVERAARKTVESELAIEQQLARRLVDLTEAGLGEPAGDGALMLRLSQQDIAALMGTRKLDSVKKIIARLKTAGILVTGRQTITIVEPDALHAIADGTLTVS